MSIRYAFDLYPRDDPKDGARILRFSGLQTAEYRGEANGTGAGRFTLRASHTDADSLSPAGMQYVRVVRINDAVIDAGKLSGFSEAVVGGFFIDLIDVSVLDDNMTELLTAAGAGTLTYLDRAIMWSLSYTSTTGRIPNGEWTFSELFTGVQTLGSVLWKVIKEAQAFDVGSPAADDRIATAIPDVILGFTGSVDSDGTPWSLEAGDFSATVGDNLVAVVKRLMDAGLYISMDPDTFELNAWESASYGRDRTGLAFGVNVVRFQSGDNIISSLVRGISARRRISTLLIGSGELYADARQTLAVDREGFYGFQEDTDRALLNTIGEEQIAAQNDAADTTRLRFSLGTDPVNGAYLPFETAGILLNDSITVDTTGLATWHFTDDVYPVSALTVILQTAGSWQAWVDLGAEHRSMPNRAFQAQPVVGHTHPCCSMPARPGGASTPEVVTVIQAWTWPTAGAGEPINSPISAGAFAWNVLGTNSAGFAAMSTAPYAWLTTSSKSSGQWNAVAGAIYRITLTTRNFGHAPITVEFSSLTLGIIRSDVIAAPLPAYPDHFNASEPEATYSIDVEAPAGTTRMLINKGSGACSVDNVYVWTVDSPVTPGTLDPTMSIGETSSAGTPSETYANPDHQHAHGNIVTGGPYHMAEDVTFAPTGTIAAATVQLGMAEIATEYLAADATHAVAVDPHTGYQKESEKGIANGYAALGSGARVPMAQLASGTPDGTKFVRDDGTLVVPAGGGGGGMSNPMTTAGDIIVGGTAGAAERLAIGTAGQVLKVVSGTPAWAAESGGGGGGGWIQEVNESGASFANFTVGTGTWASDGTVITSTNIANLFRRARTNTKPLLGAGVVYEAELRFPTTGQGTGVDVMGGLLIGTDAVVVGALSIRLDRGSTRIKVETDGAGLIGEFTGLTVNLDTWYKVRAVTAGSWVTIYLDGLKLGSRRVALTGTGTVGGADYVGLMTYNSKVNFRNIRCWSRSGDLPA